jgi:hypothetical protein
MRSIPKNGKECSCLAFLFIVFGRFAKKKAEVVQVGLNAEKCFAFCFRQRFHREAALCRDSREE